MEMMVENGMIEAVVMRLMARRLEALRSITRSLGLPSLALSEADRIAAMKASAVPPERCGPAIMAAPARGVMLAFAPMEMRRGPDGYELTHAGYRGRDAARAADAFDRMTKQAGRRGGDVPFTKAQIEVGREYAAMFERHSSSGLRGISVETMMSGRAGGGGEGYIDAVLTTGQLLGWMHEAIGGGWALEITRASKRKRTPLTVRELVDRVCLKDQTLSEILDAFGWGVYGETVIWARMALCAALDRMAEVYRGA